MYFESKEAMAAYFWEHPGLIYLRVDNCPALRSLPALPSTLIDLLVDNCPALTSLPALPSTLTNLRVDNCPALKNYKLKLGKLTIQIG